MAVYSLLDFLVLLYPTGSVEIKTQHPRLILEIWLLMDSPWYHHQQMVNLKLELWDRPNIY